MNIDTIRLKTPQKTVLQKYDVESVVLEFDRKIGTLTAFRIELGSGWYIYWVLPTESKDRLRLFLVDNALAEIDITVEADPVAFDFSAEWNGDLGTIGDVSHKLEYVSITMTESPPSFRCLASLRDSQDTTFEYVLQNPSVT